MELSTIKEIFQLVLEAFIIVSIVWSKKKTSKGLNVLNNGIVNLTHKDVIKARIHESLETVTITQLKHLKINDTFKNLLFLWSDKFEEMAIKSYFSAFRNSPDKSTYLDAVISSFKTGLSNELRQHFKETKKGLDVVEHMGRNGKISGQLGALKTALDNNGLNDDQYVRLFTSTLSKLIDVSISAFQDWQDIND